MLAEIREFELTALPFVVRFGLGSAKVAKRWSRFELRASGDLYWTHAFDIRRDIEGTNKHISVHKSGKIVSSLYQEGKKIKSGSTSSIGVSFRQITKPCEVISGSEKLEPGYLYHGLVTLTDKEKGQGPGKVFVACLDEQLVDSKLHFSFDLLPWVSSGKVIEYMTKQNENRPFDENDPRSHLFIFHWGNVSAVVTMKFTEGDGPIDIQRVLEADKHIHPLKRLFFGDTLTLSESAQLMVSPRNSLSSQQNEKDGSN
jgi:hypothetical protein